MELRLKRPLLLLASRSFGESLSVSTNTLWRHFFAVFPAMLNIIEQVQKHLYMSASLPGTSNGKLVGNITRLDNNC